MIDSQGNELKEITADRRFFHRHAERGWLEIVTTVEIAARLRPLGFQISTGKAVHAGERLGLPSREERAAYLERLDLEQLKGRAQVAGLDEAVFEEILEGYTGVVAEIDSGRVGPRTVFRFDIDALSITEADEAAHRPARENFASCNDGSCHACAHDGHISLGIALARRLSGNLPRLSGCFRIIFQPAEESVRGARSMVKAGVLQGADYFLSGHIGLGQPTGTVGVGSRGFLAVRQYELKLRGREAHAGMAPECGRNALLAACALTLQLQTLPQSGAGLSRFNVGILHSGTASNIIAGEALLEYEMRGSSSAVRDELDRRSRLLVSAVAASYELEYELEMLGEADGFDNPHPEFEKAVAEDLRARGFRVLESPDFRASEDVTLMMTELESLGACCCHFLFGADLPYPHHHPAFDFDEAEILSALEVLTAVVDTLQGEASQT